MWLVYRAAVDEPLREARHRRQRRHERRDLHVVGPSADDVDDLLHDAASEQRWRTSSSCTRRDGPSKAGCVVRPPASGAGSRPSSSRGASSRTRCWNTSQAFSFTPAAVMWMASTNRRGSRGEDAATSLNGSAFDAAYAANTRF